jgi:hypothetical protein
MYSDQGHEGKGTLTLIHLCALKTLMCPPIYRQALSSLTLTRSEPQVSTAETLSVNLWNHLYLLFYGS